MTKQLRWVSLLMPYLANKLTKNSKIKPLSGEDLKINFFFPFLNEMIRTSEEEKYTAGNQDKKADVGLVIL